MRLKQYQLNTNSAECILTSRNSTWKSSNCRNLGAKVLQLAKKLGFTISKNEDTESWNIIESDKRKDLLIENILAKANRGKSISKVSRLNIWHINQLLNSGREYMITWRQFKVLRGKRHVGKKARWFSVLENEVIENMHTRRIKEEFKGEKGFLIEQKRHEITIDKRRKEWIMFETDHEQGLEIGHIIKKSRRTAEVEAWEEDKENSKYQREEYIEESKLKKKENGKR